MDQQDQQPPTPICCFGCRQGDHRHEDGECPFLVDYPLDVMGQQCECQHADPVLA